MFTELELRNFKGFREQKFELAPLTVLIGGNGTGKSTLLQALAFMKQSSLNHRPTYSGLFDLGGPDELVYRHNPELTIHIGFRARLDALGFSWPRYPSIMGNLPITVGYMGQLSHSGTYIDKMSVASRDGLALQEVSPGTTEAKRLSGSFPFTRSFIFGGFTEGGYNLDHSIVMKYEIVPTLLREDLARFGTSPEKQLSSFYLVPASRGFVGFQFPLLTEYSHDLVAARGFQEFASNAASALAMNRDLEEQVSEWLAIVTRLRVQSKLLPNHRVIVMMRPIMGEAGREQPSINVAHEGFGTNQLTTLFLQIALAGGHATIGVEEPEIFLHPRSQRLLIETLVNILKQEQIQFILTTHSERVLSRVLLLVAKKVLKPEDVALYSFSKDEQGVCSAERLKIDDEGRVAGGLQGFFEEDVLDLREYIEALEKA